MDVQASEIILDSQKLELDSMIQLYHSWAIYTNDSISYHRDTCTCMFIDVLFTVAKKWNQLWCLSSNENVVLIHNEILFSYKER